MEDRISELAELLLRDMVSKRISEDAVYAFTHALAETREWPQNSSLDRLGQYLHSLWRSGEMERLSWEFSFHAGRLLSLVDLLKMSAELREDKGRLEADARRYQSRYMVFRAIAKEQGIRHGELARKARISESALSQFMNQIEHRNYIYYRKTGRTKYYYMLDDGKALLDKMENLRAIERQRRSRSAVADLTASVQVPLEAVYEAVYKEGINRRHSVNDLLVVEAIYEAIQGSKDMMLANKLSGEIVKSCFERKMSVKAKQIAQIDENEEWNSWGQENVKISKKQEVC